MADADDNRRPIKARSSAWAHKTASALAAAGFSPNQISVASVPFACVGGALLAWYPTPAGLLGCAAAIQGRLLCNLLDGMVAIEGGRKSAVGQLYNEFPDRAADSVLIVALGYAIGMPVIGWLGALAAALTAYVRVFGGSLGLAQDFGGPMAKQHRMAVLTVGCLLGAAEAAFGDTQYVLVIAAFIIVIGSFATCVTRTQAIAARLQQT